MRYSQKLVCYYAIQINSNLSFAKKLLLWSRSSNYLIRTSLKSIEKSNPLAQIELEILAEFRVSGVRTQILQECCEDTHFELKL